MHNISKIKIPNSIKLIILNQKIFNSITLQSAKLRSTILVSNLYSDIFFEKSTNTLKIKKIKNTFQLNYEKLNIFLKNWNAVFIKKVKFTGKGFKIIKKHKNRLIKFFFGKSHITWVMFRQLDAKKLKKRKIIFTIKQIGNFSNFLKKLTSIKPANMYTKRGLRFSACALHKRFSKKNSLK